MSKILTVPYNREKLEIPYGCIVRIFAEHNYSHIFFANGIDILVLLQLGIIWKMLVVEHPFVFTHRSQFVNFDFANRMSKNDRKLLLMKIGKPVIVSETYILDINQRLSKRNKPPFE